MKRPLYYLLCAIACTSMVSATMPMAAIAEAIQPQATATQQAQADATSIDTGKAEDGTNTNTTADTEEDSTATSTGTSQADPADANATDTSTPGTTAATITPTPPLRAQTSPAPEAISTTSQTGYAHSATATQNGVTFTVTWNDAPRGHRDDLPRNPDQRLVPGQGAHGRAHLLERRQPGERLRPVAPGMGQLLQPSSPRSRSGPKNPRGTTIHLHGASEGAYPKSEMVKPAAVRCRRARPAGWPRPS